LSSSTDNAVVLEAKVPLEESIEEEQEVSLELNFDEIETDEAGADGDGGLVAEVAAPTVDVMTVDVLSVQEDVSETGELFSPENFLHTTACQR